MSYDVTGMIDVTGYSVTSDDGITDDGVTDDGVTCGVTDDGVAFDDVTILSVSPSLSTDPINDGFSFPDIDKKTFFRKLFLLNLVFLTSLVVS